MAMTESKKSARSAIGVLGAGLMGTAIAALVAAVDRPVRILDVDPAQLEQGPARAGQIVAQLVDLGLAAPDRTAVELESRVSLVSRYDELSDCELVIEAVFEDIAVKHEAYENLEACLAGNAIIASNTSNIVPSRLAAGVQRPERFLVAHFWNPPYAVPLVEIVPHAGTRQDCIDDVVTIIDSLGSQPVVLRREVAGFIGNRLQYALLREALSIVQQGIAEPEEIDRVMTASLGRRYATTGPFATADFGGLDTFLMISQQLMPQLASDQGPLKLMEEAVGRGDCGVKSGRGMIDWSHGKAESLRQVRDTDLMNRRMRETKRDTLE